MEAFVIERNCCMGSGFELGEAQAPVADCCCRWVVVVEAVVVRQD